MTSAVLAYGAGMRERHHIPQPLSWAGKGWQVVEAESQDHTVDDRKMEGTGSPQHIIGGIEKVASEILPHQ